MYYSKKLNKGACKMEQKIINFSKCRSLLTIILLIAGSFASNLGYSKSDPDSSKISEALKLINMPDPKFTASLSVIPDSAYLADLGFEQVYENEDRTFPLRDGGHIFAKKYPYNSKRTTILLHGIVSSSYTYNKMSGLLRNAAKAEVYATDLRGHGLSSGKPGDVDYIDQYSDDLADVILNIKKEKPENNIILAGHSMGGGICLRYAMRRNFPEVDAYLLFAPTLGHNAPTLRDESDEAGNSGEAFMKIHLTRIIGLWMLNSIGNHAYDSLNVLFFNLPDDAPLKKYSYRSNLSMAPADYKKGLRSVKKPLLVIVGSDDEAYIASEYEPVIKGYSDGEVAIIDGATHNGIRHDKEAMDLVKKWIGSLNLDRKRLTNE